MSRWCSASTWLAAMEENRDVSSITMRPRSNMPLFFVSWESRSKHRADVHLAMNFHSTSQSKGHRESALFPVELRTNGEQTAGPGRSHSVDDCHWHLGGADQAQQFAKLCCRRKWRKNART